MSSCYEDATATRHANRRDSLLCDHHIITVRNEKNCPLSTRELPIFLLAGSSWQWSNLTEGGQTNCNVRADLIPPNSGPDGNGDQDQVDAF
jgi:hypothetical protein